MENFKFTHPDPDKLWRLINRWKKGISWGEQEVLEFRLLVKEWFIFYMLMENIESARKLKKQWRIINEEIVSKSRCEKKMTLEGVKYVSKRSKTPLETCL